MSHPPKGPIAPLSPILLAGLALRPVPYALLQPAFTKAIQQMHNRHGDVFERLIALGSPRYLIDPIDLPFSFIMDTNPASPALDILAEGADESVMDIKASVRGPLLQLIELLEGRIDGDALFFSRDLVVEGDTEAVLGLRNAVDGADINVHEDLLDLFGPFSRPVDGLAQIAGKIFMRFSRDLSLISQASTAPLQRKCDAQAASIEELEETIATMKKQLRRRREKTA